MRLGEDGVFLPAFFAGICQLVLMDADTSHLNVGGVFLRKQTINS